MRDHETRSRTTFQPVAEIRSASAPVSGNVVAKDPYCQYSASALTLTPRNRTSRPSASTIRPPATGSGSAWSAGSIGRQPRAPGIPVPRGTSVQAETATTRATRPSVLIHDLAGALPYAVWSRNVLLLALPNRGTLSVGRARAGAGRMDIA